ncbi:NAD(P)H-dependent oxidoreductase subunit E [Candidatus Riflebacteria bacterium]
MKGTLAVKVDEKLILQWIKKIGKQPSCCVPLLQEIQSQYGYLPREAMDIVTKNTEISASQLFGVATFYAQFRLKPVGRNLIKVCHGTACHVRGADRLNTAIRHTLKLEKGEDTACNSSYTMADVACIGCCSLAPCMMINDEVSGGLTGDAARRELKKHARQHGEAMPQ